MGAGPVNKYVQFWWHRGGGPRASTVRLRSPPRACRGAGGAPTDRLEFRGPDTASLRLSRLCFVPGPRRPGRGDPCARPGARGGVTLTTKIFRPGHFQPCPVADQPRAYLGLGVISAGGLASMDPAIRQNALNRIAAFAPVRDFSSDAAPHRFITAGASAAVQNRISPRGALSPQQQPRRKDDGSEEPRVSPRSTFNSGDEPQAGSEGPLGPAGKPQRHWSRVPDVQWIALRKGEKGRGKIG